METGNGPSAPHHLTSRLEVTVPVFGSNCDDNVGGSMGLYETPTHQDSIVTPPTGFRAKARDDVFVFQRGEVGYSGHQTTPLTTTSRMGKGLVKDGNEMQCHSSTAPLRSVPPPSESLSTTPPPARPLSTTPAILPLTTPPPTMAPPTAPPTVAPPTAPPPTTPPATAPPPTTPPPTAPPSTTPPATAPPPITSPPTAPPPTMPPATAPPPTTPPPTAPPPTTPPAKAPPPITPPPTAPPTTPPPTAPPTTPPPTAPPTTPPPTPPPTMVPPTVPPTTPPYTTAPPTLAPSTTPPSTVTPSTKSPMPESDPAYKALYHGALERLRAESSGLAAFKRLLPLITQLSSVKREHMLQVQKTSEELALCHSAVEKKIKEWTEEREAYRAEGERTVATLVAELVACNATNKVLGDRLEAVNKELLATQARLQASEDLSTRLQGLLLHKGAQLEACAAETHELKEFTELEKQTLDDTVVELQKRLRDREYDLLTQNSRHQEEASRLQEEVEKVKFRLKRESIKSYRYQAFSDRFVEHIQRTQGRKDGKEGASVELDGDTVRRTLAQWRAISFPKGVENVPPEGADEEMERVKLATQVQELNDKLCVGMAEYSRLKQMFHDYQAKSTEKVEVLKCNLEKADQEINQLDDIVDKVVKVMQDNIAAVRECPPLHSILQELVGAQD